METDALRLRPGARACGDDGVIRTSLEQAQHEAVLAAAKIANEAANEAAATATAAETEPD